MKTPGARINPLLSQTFLQVLEPLSLSSPFEYHWLEVHFFPFRNHEGSTFQSHTFTQQLLAKWRKLCSCITSTQRRSPGSTGTLVSGPQGHTGHTRAINSTGLLTRKAKTFQKWNPSFHWSLHKKPHSLEVRSLVVSYSLRLRWRTILYTWN